MHRHRIGKAEQLVGAVDLEAGEQHEDDQTGLRPVPETLEALEDIDSLDSHGVNLRYGWTGCAGHHG